MLPTFPPTFVAPPPLLTTTTTTTNPLLKNPQTDKTTHENLRFAAEALFKSNSVDRSPSTHFICSDCRRTVKLCDVSVQASLDNKSGDNGRSRLRLVSLTSSDDGLTNDDAWFSYDSNTTSRKGAMNHGKQTLNDDLYDDLSTGTIPKLQHV